MRRSGVLLASVATVTVLGLAGTAAVAQPEPNAQDELTVKAMTWNACANTAPPSDPNDPAATCVNGRQTAKVANTIRWRLLEAQPGTQVIFLQEVCSVDIERLASMAELADWEWKFAPIRHQGTGSSPTPDVTDRNCASDVDTGASRGNFGIGMGVQAGISFTATHFPDEHQPMARDRWGRWNVRQAVICGDVEAFQTTVCGAHLTPLHDGTPDDPDAFWTAQQGQVQDLIAYAEAGAYDRVIFGGDLNQPAPDSAAGYGDDGTVAPAYASYGECDQANFGGTRDGRPTYQRSDGSLGSKIDYLFTNRNATSACYVTDTHIATSDHLPVVDTITFPAN